MSSLEEMGIEPTKMGDTLYKPEDELKDLELAHCAWENELDCGVYSNPALIAWHNNNLNKELK